MTVCLDTGVFLQIFGQKQPFYPILRALLDGRLTLALSTEILLEYEEVTVKLSGGQRWREVLALLELLAQLHGNIRQVEPQYRFSVVRHCQNMKVTSRIEGCMMSGHEIMVCDSGEVWPHLGPFG